MSKILKLARSFRNDERGVTSIEYGLLASGVALAIITVVNGLGTKLSGTFSAITAGLN